MALSRYNALSNSNFKPLTFFPQVALWAMVALVVFLAYVLFPGQKLEESLLTHDHVSHVDYRYSVLLFPKAKALDISPKTIRENPQTVIHTLQNVSEPYYQPMPEKDVWLAYLILRSITLAEKNQPEVQHAGMDAMKHYFARFKNDHSLNPSQLKILARDALAIESSVWAMDFFDRVIRQSPQQTVAFYGEAARTAIWANQCEKSAKVAMLAKRRATTLNDKRYFFFLALQSLFQCQRYELAMTMAKRNVLGLEHDKTTYQLLADYALKAGKPGLAQEWVDALLKLEGF